MSSRLRTALALGAAAAVAWLASCASRTPEFPYKSHRHVRADVRPEVVESRIFEFADTFAGEVEQAADRIQAETDDPAIRRRALLWKMHAIPAAQMACFRRDPLSAVLDMWILCRQMEDFFATSEPADHFGAQQPIAIETSRWLREQMRAIVMTIAKSEENVATIERDAIEPWVHVHPLQNLLFTRDSAVALYVDLAREYGHDAFASVRSIEELAIDLTRQVRVYGTQMPKHARWQAELVRQDTLDSERVRALVDNLAELEDIARTADRGVAQLEFLTSDLDRQREAVLSVIQDERIAVMEGAAAEREAIVTSISGDRDVVLEHLAEERATILDSVSQERALVLERITQERTAVLDAVDAQRLATLEWLEGERASIATELRGAVDHAFWRLVQLLVVAVIAAPFVLRAYRFILRSPPSLQ